jgi:nucleotide-binding universal stress UspA family protein
VMETNVVGVDGSQCAGDALARAVNEAALRGARLRIVCAWEVPPAACAGGFAPPIDEATVSGLRENAQAVVRAAVAEAHRVQPSVPCEGEVQEGQPPRYSWRSAATLR